MCHLSLYLQAAATALVQGQVPLAWDALWEGPTSPLDYMRAAVRRYEDDAAEGSQCMTTCQLVHQMASRFDWAKNSPNTCMSQAVPNANYVTG